jgi:hypothetical protein
LLCNIALCKLEAFIVLLLALNWQLCTEKWIFFLGVVTDFFGMSNIMCGWQAEFLNPGGSVKDRAALYIVKARPANL